MDLIAFNNFEAKFFPASISTGIRISYLLAKDTILAGNMAGHFIHYENFLKDKDIEFKAQILLVEYKAIGDEASINSINQFITILKQNRKKSRRTTQQIVAFKRLEQVISDSYLAAIQINLDKSSNMGLTQLRPLSDKESFVYMDVSYENPEHTLQLPIRNESYKVSDLLTYATNSNTITMGKDSKTAFELINKLFIMHFDFFSFNVWNENISYLDSAHPNANLNTNIVLEKIATLPNIYYLSANELEILHNELIINTNPWNEICDEWIAACKAQDANALNLLRDKVLPVSKQLDDAIKNNELLNHVARISNNLNIVELYLGMIPQNLFIKFMLHYKLILPESAMVFMEHIKTNKFENMRIPILAMKSDFITSKQEVNEPQLSRKKYLDID